MHLSSYQLHTVSFRTGDPVIRIPTDSHCSISFFHRTQEKLDLKTKIPNAQEIERFMLTVYFS